MASDPPKLPSAEEELVLLRRLMERDATATADLAVAFLNALIDWMLRINSKKVPEILCIEAAEDAILSLIKNPGSYQSDRKTTLFSYLKMSAQGDLRNCLRREKNQMKGNVSLDSLELSSGDGKYVGQMDDQLLRLENSEEVERVEKDILTPVRNGLSPEESACLDLLLDGERKTSVFAAALRIEHLPEPEQIIAVKRVKDKLKSRIRREGSDHESS
jgi:hypothetical protein